MKQGKATYTFMFQAFYLFASFYFLVMLLQLGKRDLCR